MYITSGIFHACVERKRICRMLAQKLCDRSFCKQCDWHFLLFHLQTQMKQGIIIRAFNPRQNLTNKMKRAVEFNYVSSIPATCCCVYSYPARLSLLTPADVLSFVSL